MKRILALACTLCTALILTGCSRPGNSEYYEEAQLYLGCGEYERASEYFTQLGEYADSASYALYCDALAAIKSGDYALARANLTQIDPFKSSGRYLTYLDALEKEEAGEQEAALALYEALGTFADCDERAEKLRKAIPEEAMNRGRALMSQGEYAAARELFLSLAGYGTSDVLANNCTVALNKAAYSAADELCESGDHMAAYQAFIALGDSLDAAERAAQCRSVMLAELDAALGSAALQDAPALIEACEAFPGDEEFSARAQALQERFGMNLSVLAAADGMPYVQLGAYPSEENGREQPLIWQVIRSEDTALTLLCSTVIDASPAATATDLLLSEAERAAILACDLPSAADLASLSDLTCQATPYALAQGAEQEDGRALYWLRDSLENGLHPVVSSSGSLVIPLESVAPGVRPMITISLDAFNFTAGTGTPADPFR